MTAGLERQCADDPGATFPHLSAEQLAGTECVVCFAAPVSPVKIRHLDGYVNACGYPRMCARNLGFRPEDGWQGGRA